MTTHVLVVNDTTFKYHLEYMFAGTGAKENIVDFNNSKTSKLHHSIEAKLVAMMADGCRVRKDDFVIFYLTEKTGMHEGMFFGIFQAAEDGIFIDNFDDNQFLYDKLKKSLIFRLRIKPFKVYAQGVTEWEALDEIKYISAPCQMLWSLIYRKLRANRGNTMITIYEAERLFKLIREKNQNKALTASDYTFSGDRIIGYSEQKLYKGRKEQINILPRLIEKAKQHKAFEAHLQMYIAQNIGTGRNKSLDSALEAKNIEWIGNEVACGVGMQRIDLMLSRVIDDTRRIVIPIELKAVYASKDNTRQLARYVEWVKQYYVPNRSSDIQPVLICLGCNSLSQELKDSFIDFNKTEGILPLKYIEYETKNDDLFFSVVEYDK